MNLLVSIKAFVFGCALSFASGILTQAQTVEPADPNSQAYKLAVAAGNLPSDVRYVADYQKMDYPGGDIPADQGVCTDVLIRAFREQGIDLQVKIHEHRKSKGFGTDTNIHNRRQTPPLFVTVARIPLSLTDPIVCNFEQFSLTDPTVCNF